MPHINKQMVSFFLTTDCNLSCVYCYNKEERLKLKVQTLPFEIAKAGMEMFFSENSSRHLRFYGPGEPTRAFSLMKQIVEYGRVLGGNTVTTELQTNGCFNEEVCDWLSSNLNIIWISFDGEPDIQNANRPFLNGDPSAPKIEENIKRLLSKAHPDLMVGARVTITDLNVNRQKQMIDYFYSLGIRYIWNDPIFPSVGKFPVCDDPNKQASYTFDMDSYAIKYIEAYKYAKSKNIFYGSFLTCNFDGKCSQHCRSCTPVPHFTTDGFISACDLVTIGKDAGHMDCFVYGKWDSTSKKFIIDDEKVAQLQMRNIDNMKHCQNCSVKEHCGGYCLGEVQNETGSLLGQKPQTCKAIRMIAKEIGFSNEPYPYLHP